MAGLSNLENKYYELGLRSSIQEPGSSKAKVHVTNFFLHLLDFVAREEEADIVVGVLQENSFIPLLCY